MKYQRPKDLIAQFNEDGRITLRSESSNVGAKVPVVVCAILSFCSQARTMKEIENTFGKQGTTLSKQLIDIGILCTEEQALGLQIFENFSDINIHRRMLDDHIRLAAYREAINTHVEPGMVVIDAGAGSGILSLYAAKAGAARVYAIENNEFAKRINRIASDNGYGDVINVIQANFGTVQLPEKADVIITETFGAWALAEGAADDLRSCAQKNLKRSGKILPEMVSLHMATLENCPKGLLTPFQGRSDNVRLDHLLPSAKRRSINLAIDIDMLESHHVATLSVLDNSVKTSVTIEHSCQAIALWFDLHFDDTNILSTAPHKPMTHWKQTYIAAELSSGTHQLTISPSEKDRRGCLLRIGDSTFDIR